MPENPLRSLHALGQSLWLDYIRRDLLRGGGLARLIREDGVRGMTSNPAIFEKAIVSSNAYDEDIRTLAAKGLKPLEIYEALSQSDVRDAADAFAGVYRESGGADGFVSLEVNPHLARDTAGTLDEARRLWAALARPNVMIKVPATQEGLPAIRALIGEGINVNVTLIFGVERWREVADAYLSGLEDLAAKGRPLERVASVASFFVSRIDSMVDPLLEQAAGRGASESDAARRLRGRAAIACSKLAYQSWRELHSGARFKGLAGKGARPQRLLWASTSTKNPADSDVKYMEALVGPDTVDTAPMETLDAYRDHGRPEPRLAEGLEEAGHAVAELAWLGVQLPDVAARLEEEGIRKFNQPFDAMLESLARHQAAKV